MIAWIYGLPKIPKVGAPLRPVVSCIGSPTYFLLQQIDFIIKSSISNPASHIKYSLALKEKHENIHFSNDDILVSFDVVSLLNNVGRESFINSVIKR